MSITTGELIAKLQEVDPSGQLPVVLCGQDYWDPRLRDDISADLIVVRWVHKPGPHVLQANQEHPHIGSYQAVRI